MLDPDFVAADDHIVVLAAADALSALRQHSKILVAHGCMDSVEDRVVTRAGFVVGRGNADQPTVSDDVVTLQRWPTTFRVTYPRCTGSAFSTIGSGPTV